MEPHFPSVPAEQRWGILPAAGRSTQLPRCICKQDHGALPAIPLPARPQIARGRAQLWQHLHPTAKETGDQETAEMRMWRTERGLANQKQGRPHGNKEEQEKASPEVGQAAK